MSKFSNLGFGLGLRKDHIKDILNTGTTAQWFEALSENYMGIPGHGRGFPFRYLENVRKNFPIVLHGVSMSIGKVDGLDKNYLKRLKDLKDIFEPEWISDHLCWTANGNAHSYDLLPLPYTQEAIQVISDNIDQAQSVLGTRLVLENVSSYMEFQESEMEEWEFIAELVKKTDCGLLLDVNNVYVSSQNHNFDPRTYIDAMPSENVAQIHLAGYDDSGEILIDTHDHDIYEPVWDLLDYTYKKIGFKPTMIERDDDIPPLWKMEKELDRAKQIGSSYV